MATMKQRRFALEVAIGDERSATACGIAAGYTPSNAATQASENLRNPEVLALIEERKKELAAVAGVDPAWVIRKLKAIASVDHRKFSQTRVGCCRHCYGIDNLYQWSRGEFTRACNDAMMNDTPGPELMGGLGYNKALPPLSDCPECAGEGVERVVMFDTRELDDETAIAYLGSKKSKDKNEVVIADKVKALELIGRNLGMWNDKVALTDPSGKGPAQINHAHLHARLAVETDPKQLSEAELEAFLLEELNRRNPETLGVLAGVDMDAPQLEATNESTCV